jgi:ligand-binding sensor domain-containing protein
MVGLLNEKDYLLLHSLADYLKLVKTTFISSVLTVFSLFYCPAAFADGKTNILSFDYYSQSDGLPNNQIQCILQDRKGWIWLGTSQGLSRFDSYRFVNFIHNTEDTSSLSGSLVRIIFEDSKGNLLPEVP